MKLLFAHNLQNPFKFDFLIKWTPYKLLLNNISWKYFILISFSFLTIRSMKYSVMIVFIFFMYIYSLQIFKDLCMQKKEIIIFNVYKK